MNKDDEVLEVSVVSDNSKPVMIEQSVAAVLSIIGKGSFQKKKNDYIISSDILQDHVIYVGEEAVELRIKTMKWIPGNYEPVETAEVYKSISYEDLINLSHDEKIEKIKEIINF